MYMNCRLLHLPAQLGTHGHQGLVIVADFGPLLLRKFLFRMSAFGQNLSPFAKCSFFNVT